MAGFLGPLLVGAGAGAGNLTNIMAQNQAAQMAQQEAQRRTQEMQLRMKQQEMENKLTQAKLNDLAAQTSFAETIKDPTERALFLAEPSEYWNKVKDKRQREATADYLETIGTPEAKQLAKLVRTTDLPLNQISGALKREQPKTPKIIPVQTMDEAGRPITRLYEERPDGSLAPARMSAGGAAPEEPSPIGGPPSMGGGPPSAGGEAVFRKPSANEIKGIDALHNAQDALANLRGAVNADMATGGGKSPLKNVYEYSKYIAGYATPRDAVITWSKALDQQLTTMFTSGGPKSQALVGEIRRHFPKATDSNALILEKAKVIERLMKDYENNLIGPSGGTASAAASGMPPGTEPVYGPDGSLMGYRRVK